MSDEIESLRRQLAEAEENLRLIRERMAEYVLETDVPVDLVREERRQEVQVSDLQTRLARLERVPCPYRGLEFFAETHSYIYFGRAAIVERLLARLRETNFVMVVGPSGCGKSSLVRAGLIPALREGRLPGSERWEIDVFVPGDDGLRSLAAALTARLAPEISPGDRLAETDKLTEHLREGTVSISDVLAALRQQRPDMSRLVLVVDQFEEAFTQCTDERTRQAFFETVTRAAETPWLMLILTLPADFLGRVLIDERMTERMDHGLVTVPPMTVAERREAIEQPAIQAGRKFEDGLVERILEAVRNAPGELSLLERVLYEMWALQDASGVLTHAAYEAIGEVSGVIARRADNVFGKFTADERARMRAIFTRLVRVVQPDEGGEDRRQRVNLKEFAGEDLALVRRLAGARLLVMARDEQTGLETVEVAHEALIREWPRLREWLDVDRNFLVWRQRLHAMAAIWEESRRDENGLLRAAFLEESELRLAERPADLDGLEQAFILASRHANERLYHSCFISYSSKDEVFARQLYEDLKRAEVQCWYAPEDMPIGEKIRLGIDKAIEHKDKLLLILSKDAVASSWVESEVEKAMERERIQPGLTVLFPIRVDDAVMESTAGWAANVRRTRNIGDFRGWEDVTQYGKVLERLLRDLRVEKGEEATGDREMG